MAALNEEANTKLEKFGINTAPSTTSAAPYVKLERHKPPVVAEAEEKLKKYQH